MGKRQSINNRIFSDADFVFDEYVMYVKIKTFTLSGYDWMIMAANEKAQWGMRKI